MLNIPSALQSQFETCLRNTTMPKHAQAAYTKWLRSYLDFCQKYHFPHAQKRVFRTFFTNYRKRSKRRRNNSRHHMQSHCITSLCTTEVPIPSSLRPKRPVLRGRFPRNRILVLTHYPTKQTSQTSPTKPVLWGRLLLNRLLRPSLPPTKRTRQREFPGKRGTPGW